MEEKEKKSGWGVGIFVLYGAFVVFILTIVIFASTQNFDLVEKNYYQQELKYQNRIDQIKNTKALSEKPYWAFDDLNKNFVLFFPESQVDDELEGLIHFFRPSNKEEDFYTELNLNDKNNQTISFTGKSAGKWRVKLSWQNKIDSYFLENMLFIE